MTTLFHSVQPCATLSAFRVQSNIVIDKHTINRLNFMNSTDSREPFQFNSKSCKTHKAEAAIVHAVLIVFVLTVSSTSLIWIDRID